MPVDPPAALAAPTEQQFEIINQPDYFNDLKAKINAIRSALASEEGMAPEITTRVNDVVVVVSFTGTNEGRVRLGLDFDGNPIYDWTFPIRWLEEVA